MCTIVENTELNVLPNPLDAADAVANTPTKVIMTDINIPTGFAFITAFSTRCAVAAAIVLLLNARNNDLRTVVPIVKAPIDKIVP